MEKVESKYSYIDIQVYLTNYIEELCNKKELMCKADFEDKKNAIKNVTAFINEQIRGIKDEQE